MLDLKDDVFKKYTQPQKAIWFGSCSRLSFLFWSSISIFLLDAVSIFPRVQ